MLLLIMATMAIAMAIAVPAIDFEMKRDREEELIHRGTQYSRAVRAYFKKNGRYPTKIEDLESSNNMRFLRKRYKDPLNCTGSLIAGDSNGAPAVKCQDFKLLHFGEVQLSMSGIGGSMIPGANPMGAAAAAGALGQSSSFGQSSSSFGQNSAFGQSSFGQSSSFSSGSNTFGQNSSPTGQTQTDPSQAGQNSNGQASTDSSTSSDATANGTNPNQIGSGQIIGAPIVGVASATKDKDSTIREFNHKKKYKDWMFVYDPSQDRGTLITTPYQQIQMTQQNLNGSTNTSGSGSGQPPAGMQNNPNLPSSGFGNSNQSSSSSSQQQ
ncbi:MAG TPA: hypothetical protein VMX38_05855 [Verrucomicrobiae bacterium]|nr:hypothetical protein [Verrucomicrobiae bacterium]